MLRRKFLRANYNLIDFFNLLDQRGVQYVVLRSFREAHLRDEGDIDILFEDLYVSDMDDFLVREYEGSNSLIKVDAYSTGGAIGYGYNKLPYYPRFLSKRIIESRRLSGGLFYIPSPEIYFMSFIFHVVYHKAEGSGLPIDYKSDDLSGVAIRYKNEIEWAGSLAKQELPDFNLQALRRYLTERDWIPPAEWVRKVSLNGSNWLKTIYPKEVTPSHISVFVVRKEACSPLIIGILSNIVCKQGFRILYSKELDEMEINNALMFLRSGKWDGGPYQCSGGPPAHAYILYDPNPECVPAQILDIPFVSNYRFHRLKELMREKTKALLSYQSINCIHCCDDSIESREYISKLFPLINIDVTEVTEPAIGKKSAPQGIIHLIKDSGKRAKVELIEFNGVAAIKKTFQEGMKSFLDRELLAYDVLQECAFIPRLYSHDVNSLIIEYIDCNKTEQKRLLSQNLRDVARVVFLLWKGGFAHLDMHPDNFIISREGAVYLVDYEFFYSCDNWPKSVLLSYDLKGIPNHEEWGIKGKDPVKFINNKWIEATGLSLDEIVKNHLQFLDEV